MNKIILIILLFSSLLVKGQKECNEASTGIPVLVCSTVPNTINVCEETKSVTFEIENTTTFTLSSVTADLTMLNGVVYIAGSINGSGGADVNITNLSNPSFSLNNIAPGISTFTIDFKVNCDVFTNPPGSQYKINLALDYIGNSTTSRTTHESKSFSIAEPAISIVNVAPSVHPGTVGTSFDRCITITNQGLGYITGFELTELHGGDITINTVDLNNISGQSSTSMNLTFGPAEIMAIGDGDNLFENGEQIIFCENVTINGCENVSSQYDISWGCEGDNCQAGQGGAQETANVIFPGIIPDVKSYVTSTNNQCVTIPNNHQVKLINEGAGDAKDLKLHSYSAAGYSIYNGFGYAYNQLFDTNTIVIKLNGVVQPIEVDSVYVRNSIYNQGCGGTNPLLGWVLKLPYLPAGDSIEIDFDIAYCEKVGCYRDLFNSFAFKYSYNSVCNDLYNVGPLNGNQRNHIDWSAVVDQSPANFLDGETKTVSFYTNYFAFGFPNNNRGKWVMNFTKSSCFSLASSGVTINNSTGTTQWNSSRVFEYDSVIVAEFDGPYPFNPRSGNIEFDLEANCANCPSVTIDTANIPECSRPGGASLSTTQISGGADIELTIQFVPDTACSTVMDFSCQSFSTEVDCPGCDSGLLVNDYEFIRYSLGNPDNDEDGQPDNTGKADHPDIRYDRAVFGDTIVNTVVGVMSFPGKSKWDFAYARANFRANMDLLKFLIDTVEVYRNGTKYVCDGITPNITTAPGNSGQYLFDFSASKLIARGCLPTGFLFEDGDSIIFKSYYSVVKNRNSIYGGGAINIIDGSVSMHVNDSVEDTRECHRFYCGSYAMNISIVPITYYSSTGVPVYTTKSCDTITLSRRQYFSLGPYFTQPCANLFPKEYRNFGTIDTIMYEVPEGYVLHRARYRERRHTTEAGGSGCEIWSNNTNDANQAWINLNAVYPDSTDLFFDIGSLYTSGVLKRPSESYYGDLEIKLTPTCETPRDVEVITGSLYKWDVKYGDSVLDAQISNRRHSFRFDAPKLNLQANNPNLFAIDDTIAWIINVSNLSNVSSANNSWIGDQLGNTGVNILRVRDLDNGGLLTQVNDVYQIGDIGTLEERRFMIVADFESCLKDSIRIALGWDCPGFPDSVGAYICTPETQTLTVTPRLPEIQTTITLEEDSIRLCDTATYIVYMKNVLQGTAYNFNLNGVIPKGVTYLSGSSRVDYPYGSGLVAFPDPIVNAGILLWDISANEAFINVNGFHGITDPVNNEIEIRFKVLTDCDYTSGAKFNFFSSVVANCGDTIESDVSGSTPLVITDAIPAYNTYNAIDLFQITPCSGNAPITVTIANQGPGDFWTTDSVTVELPKNITYQGNYASIVNGPPNVTLSISYNVIGNQVLSWKLPQGLTVGDTSQFSFDVQGNADTLSCTDIPRFNVFTTATSVATCVSTNTTCDIKTITGDSTKNTFVLKSYPSIQNLTATSTLLAPSGEQLLIDLDVQNSGEPIQNGYNTTFEVFQDIDNSGTFTIADTMVGSWSTTDSIDGNNNLTHFTFPVNVTAGQGCAIFVRLDSVTSSCFCNSDVVFTTTELTVGLNDTVVCSDVPVNIGVAPSNGYLYTWDDATNLDAVNTSNPLFTRTNTSTVIDSVTKTLIVDRGGCFAYDTMDIQVYPPPIVMAGADLEYCEADTIQLNGNVATGFETSYWETLTSSTATFNYIDSLVGNTQLVNLSYGTFDLVYHKGNQYCPSFTDTVSFVNYEQPTASANPLFLCDKNSATLSGNKTPVQSISEWTKNAASTIVFGDSSLMTTNINFINYGTSEIYLEVVNGVCPVATDTVEVRNLVPHDAILPPDTSLCEQTLMLLVGNGPKAANFEDGVWHIDSSFNPNITLTQVNDSSVIVNGLVYGEARIVWEIRSDYCLSDFDTISIFMYEQPVGIVMNDTVLCQENQLPLSSGYYPNNATNYNWSLDPNYAQANSPVINPVTTASNSGSSQFTLMDGGLRSMAVGSYQLLWSVENGVCPVSIDTVEIINNPNPIADYFNTITEICQNECVDFTDLSSVQTPDILTGWEWYQNDSSVSKDQNAQLCFEKAQTNDIGLIVTTNNNCKDTLVKANAILVKPNPIAGFSYSPVECLQVDDMIYIKDESKDASMYSYDFGDGFKTTSAEPNHYYNLIGDYEIMQAVENNLGCVDTIRFSLYIDEQTTVYVPNAFTPDGDGKNDFFTPVSSGILDYDLKIFNRWGDLIFESDVEGIKWDGTFKGEKAKQDIYVWKLQYKEKCGEQKLIRGHVTLVR